MRVQAGQQGVDVFVEHAEKCHAPIGTTSVIASHTSCVTLGAGATIHAKAQDSYSLVYMIENLPRHEFWSDEGREAVPDLRRTSMHLMDLRASGNARFSSTFNTLNILIPREALATLAEQTGRERPVDFRLPRAWTFRDPVVEGFETSILQAIHLEPAIDPLVRDHLLLALVSHLATRYGGLRTPPASMAGAMSSWQLRRAQELMAANLTQRVVLAEIARQCDMSPTHFSRAFRASTGQPPSEWLLTYRVDSARDLLRTGNGSLADIANQCGFADQAHFSRTFSRVAGESPGAWRRRYRRD
jgi:AraC-like DNA-binding protein